MLIVTNYDDEKMENFTIQKCPNCNGYGTIGRERLKCPTCNGKGVIVIDNFTGELIVKQENEDTPITN